jgi:tetratricopeptide (TPR) repeat protein
VLYRLDHGQDIRQCALVESTLAEPLPQANLLAAMPAVIRRFEPNGLLVDVEAKTNALLVLAEAWYPGWGAEIDGQPAACLPVNTWMRAVPVRAGRHQVRLYFRQDYLLPGFLISLASLGLLVAAVAKRRRSMPSPLGEPEVARVLAQPGAGGKRPSKRPSKPLAKGPGTSSWYRPLLRVLAFGVGLAFAGLLIYAEFRQVRTFRGRKAGTDAVIQRQMGVALLQQHRIAEAESRFIEAVRLAEYACELTGYRDPREVWTLGNIYAATGRLDKAFEAARKGREVALARGQTQMAEAFRRLMESYDAASKAQAGDRK